jgi:1-acyl-sn-glycerol-3-phosphate acyltransferase
MGFWAIRRPLRIAVKKEVFDVPLLGPLVRLLGGMPIVRESSHNYTDQLAQLLENTDEIALAISPPGTRSPRPYWRTGFYYVAMKAKCPIVLGFLDWKRKEMGLGSQLTPSGDLDQDFAMIRAFYADKPPRFPDKVTPIRHRGEITDQLVTEH